MLMLHRQFYGENSETHKIVERHRHICRHIGRGARASCDHDLPIRWTNRRNSMACDITGCVGKTQSLMVDINSEQTLSKI